MRVARIFVDRPLAERKTIALDGRAARHVQQVLRLRTGQSIMLFSGDGEDWSAEILRNDRGGTVARVIERCRSEPPPRLSLHLGIGISRGERMDFAIQKSVELGVTAVTPLRTERTVVQLDPERAARRHAHWYGIVIAACEQSGRSRLPALNPVIDLAPWLSLPRTGLMLDHRAPRALVDTEWQSDSIDLLIGPEGGLAASERDQAIDTGLIPVRLGPRVLRTETAPLAALAAIQALWGDFRD